MQTFREEKTEDMEFDVSRAMDDMRARVLTGMIENLLSKIIPQRRNKEIGSNIHEMSKITHGLEKKITK